jgi:hypothetical protein
LLFTNLHGFTPISRRLCIFIKTDLRTANHALWIHIYNGMDNTDCSIFAHAVGVRSWAVLVKDLEQASWWPRDLHTHFAYHRTRVSAHKPKSCCRYTT